jgi:uncharacterized membrane protein HdeD (DUF308 family)
LVRNSGLVARSANTTAFAIGQDWGAAQNSRKGEMKMLGQIDVLVIQVTQEMIHHWGWFLAFGIVLMLLGLAAVVRSVTATVASVLFLGWLMVCASIIDLVSAFMVGKWAGFFLHLALAILFGITGVLFLKNPGISAEVATLVMSMFFLIAGIYQLVVAIWTHIPGYGWQAANGAITFLLGGLLLAQWPVSGLYAIGLFVGIDLIVYGWVWVALALNLRKL